MFSYLIKRTLQSILVVFLVSSGCFILMHLMPGTEFTKQAKKLSDWLDMIRLNHMYGFDKPVLVQYLDWLKHIIHGQFFSAGKWGAPQSVNLWPFACNDLILIGSAWVLSLVISVPWGIYNSVHPYEAADTMGTIFAYIGFSIPAFIFGFLLQVIFSLKLDWLPPSSMYDPSREGQFLDLLPHMVLPVTVLAFAFLVSYMKYTRNSFMEVMSEEFVRTARAKGASDRRVIYKHVLRNAIIPMITVLAMDIKDIIGGAAVVEIVFNWPGMGSMLVMSAEARYYPVIIAIVMVTAVMVVLANWLADILYAIVDPRIRHART